MPHYRSNREEIMAENESKSDKFKRLATKRVSKAIKSIEIIGKLSSSAYHYAEEDVEKIFSALQASLDNTKSSFSTKTTETRKFEL